MQQLGETRSASERNHALLTPETFVRAPLPGMRGATAIVHTSPAMGASFTQYTAEFEPGGRIGPTAAQRFVYVLEGELAVSVGQAPAQALARRIHLSAGGPRSSDVNHCRARRGDRESLSTSIRKPAARSLGGDRTIFEWRTA